MRREQSDDCVVPQAVRKSGSTAAQERGGKAITANKEAKQLELHFATADNPQGNVLSAGIGQPMLASTTVPKAKVKESVSLPAMVMEEIAATGNLMMAFFRVAANKGAPGTDRQTIAEVKENISEIVRDLNRLLLSGVYHPGMVRRVWIPKGGGGQRGLGIPNVVDRIVQQAVLQIMSPHYEQSFNDSSHGFRPNRSCHTAINSAKAHIEAGYHWVVDIDLEKFFDQVHHQRLLARLSVRIQDKRLLDLIRSMLKAQVVLPNGVVINSEAGTPQGGPLSPLLSNIVLDELDAELSRRGHRFVRYADDCNIYVRSERAGQRVMESIRHFIEKRLRLKVNEQKSAVARPEERHFLGFRLQFIAVSNSVEVLLSKRSMARIREKIVTLIPRNFGQSSEQCFKMINLYLKGWINFFGICTGGVVSELKKLDAHIRRRLRSLLLKQHKRKRYIARFLIHLGVSSRSAWRGVYKGRMSWWALSHTWCVERGLSNAYFSKRGIVSLVEHWHKQRTRDTIALSHA